MPNPLRCAVHHSEHHLRGEAMIRGTVGLQVIRCLIAMSAIQPMKADPPARPSLGVPKFELGKSALELERRTQSGSFFDVIGHKSAVFGYENRTLEAWVYPMKILDDFRLAF